MKAPVGCSWFCWRTGCAWVALLAVAVACGSETPTGGGYASTGTDASAADGNVAPLDGARTADGAVNADGARTADGAVNADGAVSADGGGRADASKVDVLVSGSKLLINELAAMGTTVGTFNPGGGDWVELWNGTDQAVDLTGYRTGGLGPGFAGATALPKMVIAPKGYQLIYFNHEAKGFPVVDKKLKSDGAVGLWEPNGKPVDLLDWFEGDCPETKSWGRSPDGSLTFKTFDKPTPGAANP